ncbi:MAG: helix-turn-helix domain-containing protein [Flavobacteriaceae bacterium]|nr:helix-turn-helix domain-containing protein [Flavobacteriaceae bacterium]
MKEDITNPELELALNFVEKTDRNIFLTGKAGTGKTTFLHKIKTESNKRLVVVAPTGVAAINAKGVTIHSFFQMPFGPIVPGVQGKKSKFRFGKVKIDIIRSLDLLIIDEISMVRADLLDGVDQVLRRYKNRNKVFGGVQVLMIGDLQQLSPVVKPYEWDLLSPHYETPYFFSSITYKKANTIGIELKHIYRQDNQEFINILNEIRNDRLSVTAANKLNERYQPKFSPKKEDGYITLTTHNNRANTINDFELNKLDVNDKVYKATIKGKFNEYAYPTHEKLKLKVGSQVMFIKNDSALEKRYYNGKIGIITYLKNDSVGVKCLEDANIIDTTSEIWKNITYSINQDTKEIKEDIAGSFSQIPLRLAWAITIHKSQGLTFEKAIIDAEASFAHGQTYVALSRCKTLEGIILKTKITNNAIINDNRVIKFTNKVEENLPNKQDLNKSKKIYQLNLIEDLFSYQSFLYPIQRLTNIYYENKTSLKGNIIKPLNQIKDIGIVKLMQVSSTFKSQLVKLSENVENPEEDKNVQERIYKGINYFIEYTLEHIKKPLNAITFLTDNKTVKKDFTKQLDNLETLLKLKLACLWGLSKNFSTSKFLEIKAKAVLEESEIITSKKKGKVRVDVVDTDHPVLFEQLRILRLELSNIDNCPPFQIFTQISLFEMCAYFPKTPIELKKINGMGKIRVKKYGDKILEIINKYVLENKTTPKEEVYINKPESIDTKPKSITTKKHSFNLFKSGKTVEEIAKERGFTKTTIEGHLSNYIKTGDIKITELIPKEKYLELKKIMKTIKYDGFSELKNKIDDKFSYGELRMVAIILDNK